MASPLVEELLAGSALAMARAISILENDSPDAPALIDALHPSANSGYRMGITGPPGAGKSTLVDQLTRLYRNAGQKVGILAVDPTSPFSGGALLGDRVRMGEHFLDHDVFIRSMANRGEPGGLAARSQEVGDVLSAGGFDVIIFETVGVGQTELDVVSAVDTTMVVLVPESGDDIQLLKAGIYEAADIFVINKSDRPGADRLHKLVEQLLDTHEDPAEWQVPVCQTSALQGVGVAELRSHLERHRAYLRSSGVQLEKRRLRARRQVESLLAKQVMGAFWTAKRLDALEDGLDAVPPYQLVRTLLDTS